MPDDPSHNLFSYGTLQRKSVQLRSFGRRLEGTADTLPGFVLGEVEIEDEAVVTASGSRRHPIADPGAGDGIPGMVFRITDTELAAADSYEVAAYKRVEAVLASGVRAWVYVRA